MFNAWDSPHFQLIAQNGYAHPDYAFLPAYPILIRIVGGLLGNYWVAGFLLAQFFSLASVVMFQLTAELYMDRKQALYATALMVTFPYLFVFTTLSYSEPLFLFSTVATWYFYKKKQVGVSAILAGIASVTKIYGIGIVVPIIVDIVHSKRYRALAYLVAPIASLTSWFVYCYFSAGDPLATWADEQWYASNILSKLGVVQTIFDQLSKGLSTTSGKVPYPFIDVPVLLVLCFFGYLVAKTREVDWALATFPIFVAGGLLLTATNHLALLRLLLFLFPIWLTFRLKNPYSVAACIALFIPVTIALWMYAINVTFIG